MRALHTYSALVLGILFSLLGLSGSWLVYYPELDTWLLSVDTRATGSAVVSWQRVLDASDAAMGAGSGMTSILLPFGDRGPVRVMSQTGPEMASMQYAQAYLDPGTARVLAHKQVLSPDQPWQHNISGVAAAIHMGLFAGSVGYIIIGGLGICLLLTTLTGLGVWWPRGPWRRSAFIVTSKANSPAFIAHLHRVSGLYMTLLLLVMSVSGVYLGFRPWIDAAMGRIVSVTSQLGFAHAHVADEAGHAAQQHGSDYLDRVDLDRAIAAARGRFPDRELKAIRIMRGPMTSYLISLAAFDGSTRVAGTTDVLVDARGAVLESRNPDRESAFDFLSRWLRPFHLGNVFGPIGRALVFISGLLPLGFFATGVWIWLRRTQRARRAPRQRPQFVP